MKKEASIEVQGPAVLGEAGKETGIASQGLNIMQREIGHTSIEITNISLSHDFLVVFISK